MMKIKETLYEKDKRSFLTDTDAHTGMSSVTIEKDCIWLSSCIGTVWITPAILKEINYQYDTLMREQ